MKLSDAGLELIIESEGKLQPIGDGRYLAYRCPAGVWTIYTGCTEGVHEGMIISEAEGKAMFRRELAKHEAAVARLVAVDLTQGQYDSLVSFSYNCGIGALTGSTLLKKLNAGDTKGACNEFSKWDKCNGKPLRGLTIRRAKEAALFASRDEAPMMAQAVDVPKDPMTATGALIKVAAPAAAGLEVARNTISLPPPPTEALQTAGAWKSFAAQATEFGQWLWAPSNRVSVAIVLAAMALVIYWSKRQESNG
jgi:lysozyme